MLRFQISPQIACNRQARGIAAALSDLRRIFRVGHRLHPGHETSVQRFLHCDVGHAIGRRGAVPVLFARRNPHDIAGPYLKYRTALGLDPADARDDVERLAERVGMPVGPCARLEGDAIRGNARRGLSGNDRILPDRAGEIFLRRPAGWPRSRRDEYPWNSSCDDERCWLAS